MIASTSHDMRTPLNTIVNMLRLIQTKITDEVILKWINVAHSSTNLLLFLVNDTLDYFQIKSGKFSPRQETFNIRDLIQHNMEYISVQLEQKGL